MNSAPPTLLPIACVQYRNHITRCGRPTHAFLQPTPPESDLPPQGLSTQRVISWLAFLGSLLPLTWALLDFWHFLLLNPLVQSVWPLRKSTPTLIPPPPLSPFKILVGYGEKEAIKVFTFKPKVQKFKSICFPTQAFLVFRDFPPWGALEKDEMVSLLQAALHPHRH